MERTCLRPGCTTSVSAIGVCISCANSDWDPTETGVQTRDSKTGQFFVTSGHENVGSKRSIPRVR